MKKNTVDRNVESKAKAITLDDIKKIASTHKKEIVIGGLLATTIVCLGIILHEKHVIDQSKDIIESLVLDNVEQQNRICELESLCKEKDTFFKSMISDALRHGSSEGGRQMAFLKDSLNAA